MKIVADTSVFLAVALGEPEKHAILKATADCELAAPELLPYELGNALTAMLKRRKLDSDQLLRTWDLVSRIPVKLSKIDLRAALQIARTQNLYAYDAYFLQCALALGTPLLTLDRRMLEAATNIGIPILEVSKR